MRVKPIHMTGKTSYILCKTVQVTIVPWTMRAQDVTCKNCLRKIASEKVKKVAK